MGSVKDLTILKYTVNDVFTSKKTGHILHDDEKATRSTKALTQVYISQGNHLIRVLAIASPSPT